jgi:hypothetical protein
MGSSTKHVGFEVITEVVGNGFIFWDITPCSLMKVNASFVGIFKVEQ